MNSLNTPIFSGPFWNISKIFGKFLIVSPSSPPPTNRLKLNQSRHFYLEPLLTDAEGKKITCRLGPRGSIFPEERNNKFAMGFEPMGHPHLLGRTEEKKILRRGSAWGKHCSLLPKRNLSMATERSLCGHREITLWPQKGLSVATRRFVGTRNEVQG